MSHKSAPLECPTRVSRKSVPQECPTRVSFKSAPQECPTRVSHKSVLQECPTTVSYKSVPQEWASFRRECVLQECPTKVSPTSVSRFKTNLFERLFSSTCWHSGSWVPSCFSPYESPCNCGGGLLAHPCSPGPHPRCGMTTSLARSLRTNISPIKPAIWQRRLKAFPHMSKGVPSSLSYAP